MDRLLDSQLRSLLHHLQETQTELADNLQEAFITLSHLFALLPLKHVLAEVSLKLAKDG